MSFKELKGGREEDRAYLKKRWAYYYDIHHDAP
jgi:hypothetical protein